MKNSIRIIGIILLHLLVFCGGTQPRQTTEKLCKEANLTLIDRLTECKFISGAEAQDMKQEVLVICAQVDEHIRDYDGQVDVCIPWVETAHCDDLAFRLITQPDECRKQFTRK